MSELLSSGAGKGRRAAAGLLAAASLAAGTQVLAVLPAQAAPSSGCAIHPKKALNAASVSYRACAYVGTKGRVRVWAKMVNNHDAPVKVWVSYSFRDVTSKVTTGPAKARSAFLPRNESKTKGLTFPCKAGHTIRGQVRVRTDKKGNDWGETSWSVTQTCR